MIYLLVRLRLSTRTYFHIQLHVDVDLKDVIGVRLYLRLYELLSEKLIVLSHSINHFKIYKLLGCYHNVAKNI